MSKKLFISLLIVEMVLSCAVAFGAAKAATSKPAAKPAAKGTTQLAGGWGEIGKEYTVGKECPVNIVLKSAEYTVGQVRIGNEYYYPNAEQKLLVVHYTLRNPQKNEIGVYWDTLSFTAVDSTNANHEYIQNIGLEINNLSMDCQVKPAQKMDAYAIIPVPAKGSIPKLIVKASDDQVVRYDLKDKVKRLEAPYADPADKTGYTALVQVPGKAGDYYPVGTCDIKFEQAAYKDGAIGDRELEEGNRFLEVFVTVKNQSPIEYDLYWDALMPTVRTTDGDDVEWTQDMLYAKRNDSVETKLKTGQELKVRYYYQVPEDVELKSFLLQQGEDGRIYEFDLSDVK